MSEAICIALINSLNSIVTVAMTVFATLIGNLIVNKRRSRENKKPSSSKNIVKNMLRRTNWNITIPVALVIGALTFFIMSSFVFAKEYCSITSPAPVLANIPTETTTNTPTPTATNTPATTATNTPKAALSCPNAKVESLNLLVSSGKWNQYNPDQNGKINPSLSREELGTLTKLSGDASLINAGDCSCIWRGSLQYAPLEPISNSSGCNFSINISSSSEKITRVNLELTLGNNQPTLFTISLP